MAEVLFIGVVTLIASAGGTFTGFGLSTLMVPMVVFFLPFPETLLLVGVLHWANDLWKLILFRSKPLWGLILGFGIPGAVAGVFGAGLVARLPEMLLLRIFGVLLISYTVFLFLRPSFRLAHGHGSSVISGLLSGFIAGLTGTGGAVRSAFLTAFNLPKYRYLFTSGATAMLIDTTRIATYAASGTRISAFSPGILVLLVAISFLGANIAKRFVDRVPQKAFRLAIAIFLFLVGIKFVIG